VPPRLQKLNASSAKTGTKFERRLKRDYKHETMVEIFQALCVIRINSNLVLEKEKKTTQLQQNYGPASQCLWTSLFSTNF
jgi:hypothetical protein